MKAISELQQEVRIIRRELNSLDARLARLDEELQDRKNAPVSSNAPLYNAVYGLASHLPAIVHPLTAENSAVKKQYLALLIMSAAGSVSEDQLLLLQRIIFTDKEDNRLDSYIAAAAALSPKDIIYKLEDAIKEKLAKILLLDMLLVANLSRTKDLSAFEFIADTAAVLCLPTNEMRFIAETAAAILTRKLDFSGWSDAQILEAHNNFGCYLKELPDPNGLNAEAYREAFKKASRRIKGRMKELPDLNGLYTGADRSAFRKASRRIIDRIDEKFTISWKCNNGQKVAEGDVLCKYHYDNGFQNRMADSLGTKKEAKELTAPVSGCFYHFSYSKTNYAIITCEDDNLDSIKAWIKNERTRS